MGLARRDAGEAGLVGIARVGTLLDLDHLDVLDHLEPVPSRGQQDDIPRPEFAAFKVDVAFPVKIDPETATAQKQDFLGILDGTPQLVVHVGLDHMSGGVAHEAELLRKVSGSEELDARLAEAAAEDHGEFDAVERDALDQLDLL